MDSNILQRRLDMDSAEWLFLDMRPGQSFLSTRPFKCPVCGWKSDRWFMNGTPHPEPHLMCPNEHYPKVWNVPLR
jgi:hypothetical protein